MATTTKKKPASYWVMLVIIFIAFISVAATAKADQPTASFWAWEDMGQDKQRVFR